MSEEEWGPWIEHDGKGCPCVGKMVQAYVRGNKTGEIWLHPKTFLAGSNGGKSWCWAKSNCSHFIRYRIRKPKALRDLIELVENLPQTERVDA